MPLDPPMMVRNTYRGPLVFSPDGSPNNYIEFAGAGDPDGKDVRIVPADFGNSVEFRKNMNLGLLKIEDNQVDITTALAGQKSDWDQRMANMASAAEAAIESSADNDMVMKECIGPGQRSGEGCGQMIPQRADEQAVHPPLCQAHSFLAGQYTASKTGRFVGSREEVVWTRSGATVSTTT